MSQLATLEKLNERLQPLFKHWQPGSGPCPLVVAAKTARRVSLQHYSGGTDIEYVVVSPKTAANLPDQTLTITLGYAPHVPGTALIYDATSETMQGKARPFNCELQPAAPRIFALLPFQIEGAVAAIDTHPNHRQYNIRFIDGRGEPIHGALPLEILPAAASKQPTTPRFLSTDRSGTCRVLLNAPASVQRIQVRSLLTGHTYELPTTKAGQQ